MIVKNDLRVFLALALVVCGGVWSVALSTSSNAWGPLNAWVRVEAKTPLYSGQAAELEATVCVSPYGGMEWNSVDIALVWRGGGMEILGDDVIYLSIDPPETVNVSFQVRVNSSKANGGFNVYMRATPQAYRCLTPNSPIIRMAESGVEKIGKGWMYLNQGGDNWKTVKGDEKGELLTGEERAKIRRKKEGAFAKKLAATRADNYWPDESTLAAIDQGLVEEMQAEMDSALADVSGEMRVELSMVAEELGRRTETPPEDAAAFLCRMVRSRWRSIWQTDPNADINKVAAPVLEIHGLERLEFMFKETRRAAASPTGKVWEAFGRASKGEMTWDEAEAELDSLLREHPEDKELLRNAPGIREIIEGLKKEEEEEGEIGDSNMNLGTSCPGDNNSAVASQA